MPPTLPVSPSVLSRRSRGPQAFTARAPATRRRILALLAAAGLAAALTACTSAGANGPDAAAPTTTAAAPCTVSAKLVPSCGAMAGVSTETGPNQTWDQAVTAFEQKTGRPADLLHDYHLWDTAFPDSAEAARASIGQKLMFSWIGKRQNGTTVSWSSIASGAEDTVIDAEATRIADMGVPVFVNFQNEPESSVGTSGTAADYVAAWRHIHDRFAAAGATNAIWTVVYMGVISDNKLALVKALYPGDAYVDWIAWDPYDWGSCRGSASVSFADTVSPFYNWLTTNGYGSKPFMLAEYGTVEDPANPAGKANWFTAEDHALANGQFPNLKALSYFDHPAPPASCNWSIGSTPGSITSYSAFLSHLAARTTMPISVPGVAASAAQPS